MLILIAGPECSGKTTLAQSLSDHFKGILVPEFAPEFLDELNRPYEYDDILSIAKKHFELFESLKQQSGSGQYIFLDSFLLNLKIWSIYRFGKLDPWIESKLRTLSFDIIFLLRPNLPWEYKPHRENPGDRDFLFDRYKTEMLELNWPYHIIDATGEHRLQQCLNIIEELGAQNR